ncbi:MAG: type I DNA topoisomerase [bacterium]
MKMAKNLVIVESPAKAKTINKILGKDFTVRASMGHVRDLPQKELGVDVENNFKPKYGTIKGREKVIKELKEFAAGADTIYLAPDPDREGEAIAWHLMAALKEKKNPKEFLRVTYNEITAPAIREAFAHPRKIDQNKVDAQQARRVLDRIVGYQVSPLLWRRIRGASSAGRVQSVALRLVCEREALIANFKPEEYWLMGARVRKWVDPRDPFQIRLARINDDKAEIKSSEQAAAIQADLQGRALKVSAILRREISKRAQPSYITSTLQQAASRYFGFAPKRAMQIAQRLYEGVDFGEGAVGLITYMRTDSFAISPVAQQACREFIVNTYGREFIPETPNFYKSRGSAQEAHEAIRPTEVTRTPDQLARVLQPDELKLYRMIWQRFVASQMANAKIAQRTVEFDAVPPVGPSTALGAGKTSKYLFRASSSEILFPGYMKVTGVEEEKKKEDDPAKEGEDEETFLPPLAEGESVEHLDWLSDRKETQPPPRYTEASLIKTLEENGVGRPSTYAQTISTILDRSYVEKDKRALKPTSMGVQVNDYLVQHLGELFDVKFTAGMEELLDEVEEGKVGWTDMMEKFYASFKDWLVKAKGPPADVKVVRRLIQHLDGVKEWAPETKRGTRTYGDKRFVDSVLKQLDDGEKPISDRQLEALSKLAVHYEKQVPGLDELAAELGITKAIHEHKRALQPPGPEMIRKLELLANVQFAEPRKVGTKVYDDKVFSESLRAQVVSGRGLTENQNRYLDRLVLKYSEQIPDFERIKPELGIKEEVTVGDATVGPFLELMLNVKEWKPPVQRGNRTWDDKQFFESLSRQFGQKKQLSFKQAAALKKMIRRYAEHIPNYDGLVETMGLLPGKQAKEEVTGDQ